MNVSVRNHDQTKAFHCIKPALVKCMDENVMHRSLYEKVRKKVMNEQRKTQMNTYRDPCGYWFLEILPYRTMICCFHQQFLKSLSNILTSEPLISSLACKQSEFCFVKNNIPKTYLFHVTYAFCLIMFKIIIVQQNAKYSMYKQ